MIMDFHGWARIHNYFSPGCTASLVGAFCFLFFFSEEVEEERKKKKNRIHCFMAFPENSALNIYKAFPGI